MTAPPRLAIIGTGKMGRAVSLLAAERGWTVATTIGRDRNAHGEGISRATLAGADVAIEFTTPDAAPANVLACARAGCSVVCGTTGWDAERAAVEREVRALDGALFWAPNFSIGVNLFWSIAADAARRIGAVGGFGAHIVETHHAAKKDAPSGTAIELRSRVATVLGQEVDVTSIRVGSVPGTHDLLFDGPFEQIRLEHVARDRRVFAEGALAAARWLVGKRGVFTMRDLLDSETSGT